MRLEYTDTDTCCCRTAADPGAHMHTMNTRVQGMLASDVQRTPIRANQLPQNYAGGLREVVATMLQVNPQTRPTAVTSLVNE
jgi:hypothetical protein